MRIAPAILPIIQMKTRIAQLAALVVLLSLANFAGSAFGQTTGTTLSGTVSASSGAPVAGAKISIKNLATSQSTEAQTSSSGAYEIPNLASGDYELTLSADGFDTLSQKVTITADLTLTLNLTLKPSLSLNDLGFSQSQVQGNPKEQARLDKRSHMLKIHQSLGLITTIPLAATVISGFFSGGKNVTSSSTRDLHVALGSVTAGLYFTSAAYAIFAPKVHGTKTEGPIRWHKALAWIHGPGMILTPIMGEMAFVQRSKGERVHGFAHYHGQVAIVTSVAYGLAIIPVTMKSGVAKKTAHVALSLFHIHRSPPADSGYELATDKAADELLKNHSGN